MLNEKRSIPCARSDTFLHSEGTVTFELTESRAPFCLLHAQHPNAYRYVPRTRVDELLTQAASARDRWTTQLIIHKGQPPADRWRQYQGLLRHLAGEVRCVLNDLREALPVLQATQAGGSAAVEYAAIADQLDELLGSIGGGPPSADDSAAPPGSLTDTTASD